MRIHSLIVEVQVIHLETIPRVSPALCAQKEKGQQLSVRITADPSHKGRHDKRARP